MSDMREHNLGALCLIYCLDRLADGSYVALNRHYKPIGYASTEWVEYENLPIRFKFKRELRPADVAALSVHGDPSAERIYLHLGPNPTDEADWVAYSKRLRMLAAMTVSPVK